MPFTFIGFLFATLALVGIPPFIGFWSKDLIVTELSLAHMNVQVLLVLITTIFTSYYMFRALIKTFLGPECRLAQEKNLHEAPWPITVPLMILSVVVLLLGFMEIHVAQLLNQPTDIVFELPIIASALLAITIGFIPSYFVFYLNRPNPSTMLQTHPALATIRKWMLAGYGFDALYLKIFVRPCLRFSNSIRRIQTGVIAENLWPILALIAILAFWVLLNL
jgi:NADH-quinone oxidoreductase subunit L